MTFSRCYACMGALPGPDAACPRCGRKNSEIAGSQKPHALPCGFSLHGRYCIGRVLGQGGFGISYLGWDLAMETRVCVKEYYPDGAAMRDSSRSSAIYWGTSENAQSLMKGRESFVKEARKAVKIRDLPSVVSVWDVFFENGTAYIVMDYVEGETLKSRLERGGRTLTPEEAAKLLLPVMRDLDKVHARGIVHRDISPDNIMLRPDGSPMLLDLGAAKDLTAAGGASSALVVKKGFSPIEQYVEGGSVGPWTDVYAMCATFIWCMTGRRLPEPYTRINGKGIGLEAFPPAVADVLEQGLTIQPEQRIQSVSELADRLEDALNIRKDEPRADETLLALAYDSAAAMLREGDADSLAKAVKGFEALGSFRDAKKLAEEAKSKIAALEREQAERDRREAQRRAAEENRRAEREIEQRRRELEALQGADSQQRLQPDGVKAETEPVPEKMRAGKGRAKDGDVFARIAAAFFAVSAVLNAYPASFKDPQVICAVSWVTVAAMAMMAFILTQKKKKPVLIGTGLCALSSLCSYVITRSKLTPSLSKYYEPIQYNGIPIILTVTAVLAYLVLILSLTRPFATRKLFYLPAVIRVLGLAAMVLCWEFDEDALIISLFFSAEAAALLFVGLWSKTLNAQSP